MASGRVVRLDTHGETVTMWGTGGGNPKGGEYQEPRFRAIVLDSGGRRVGDVDNATLLALKGGTVRAVDATDEQILEAVLGDESIFAEDDGG